MQQLEVVLNVPMPNTAIYWSRKKHISVLSQACDFASMECVNRCRLLKIGCWVIYLDQTIIILLWCHSNHLIREWYHCLDVRLGLNLGLLTVLNTPSFLTLDQLFFDVSSEFCIHFFRHSLYNVSLLCSQSYLSLHLLNLMIELLRNFFSKWCCRFELV